VQAYFGYAGGFTSLFENAETFDVSGGTSFSGATLMELLDLSDLSGTIISSVVESLRHVVDIFNHSGLSTSTDITNQTTWRWGGFMPEGDMIWIPSGIQVNLTVNVDAELGRYVCKQHWSFGRPRLLKVISRMVPVFRCTHHSPTSRRP
jgi:hypothetical protein